MHRHLCLTALFAFLLAQLACVGGSLVARQSQLKSGSDFKTSRGDDLIWNERHLPKDDLSPPPPDAPTLPGGVLHRPIAASRRQRSVSPGEWLLMVDKSFRSDFAAVLQDLGDHLSVRFGIEAWREAAPMVRRAWAEHVDRQRAAGEGWDARFKVESIVAAADGGDQKKARVKRDLMAFQMDKRLLVKVVVPPEVRHRESEIVGAQPC